MTSMHTSICQLGLLILLLFFRSPLAQAYPEFIAYGYKTCLTCHYLGTGGGGLTDYGRAVFASEIAAKPPGMGNVDDEKLANYSHFLGGVPAPFWLKPGIKYRRLMNIQNPSMTGLPGNKNEETGKTNTRTRYIQMQTDLNIASFINEDATFGFVGTLSYVDEPSYARPNTTINGSEHMMAREYFFRWLQSENSIWYVGLFDKSFGIKHPDHTAVNREAIGVGMNDQVHGVLYQWQKDKHEIFIHPYLGNVALPGAEQKRGASVMYEYEPQEKTVFGLSVRSEKDETDQLTAIAAHARLGLLGNHSFLNELGYTQSKASTSDSVAGLYDYLELQLKIVRGLYFQSVAQLNRSDLKQESYGYDWGFGFLYFPVQRIEIRSQVIQSRTYSTKTAAEDTWVAQAQLHLSL
jgi:hypothetical protein